MVWEEDTEVIPSSIDSGITSSQEVETSVHFFFTEWTQGITLFLNRQRILCIVFTQKTDKYPQTSPWNSQCISWNVLHWLPMLVSRQWLFYVMPVFVVFLTDRLFLWYSSWKSNTNCVATCLAISSAISFPAILLYRQRPLWIDNCCTVVIVSHTSSF